MAGPSREGEILDGKYRIVRKLGEGGMGAVYAGEHVRLKKAVAIKMLHAGANVLAEMADRFEREAQAASQIGSDHIVEVFDIGITAGGDRFMVMEYLEGEPLRTRLRRLKRMREAEVAELGIQLLEGLRAAHQAGIVHRDLKPDNVFICQQKAGRRDFVKVLDFGISKFAQAGDSGAVTKTGTIMGSPNYMSPEHVQASHEVDARSDLYSVGIVLWEAVTGKLPRKAATFAEILFKVVYEPVQDPRSVEPDIDPDFAAIVVKACAHPKEGRFQSADAFKAALEGFLRARRSIPDDIGSTTTVLAPTGPAAPAAPPAPLPSSPGSTSQPQLGGSQPSFNGPAPAAYPGAPVMTPSSGAIPSQPAFGAASQPGFAASSQPGFGASSQPGFGVTSQPAFGATSQPSFGNGPHLAPAGAAAPASSQPSFGNGSQPSFGSGSQPSFASGSQPSYASQFSVTHQGGGDHARPNRRIGVVLALLAAAVAGVAVAVVVATQATDAGRPPAVAASGRPTDPSRTEPPAAPTGTPTEPSSSPVESSAPEANGSATPTASTTAKRPASTGSPPTARPPTGKPTGGKPPGGDKPGIKPGY